MTLSALDPDIATLGRWLAGDFSNWEQAIDNPPLYAHIRVGMRPLPAFDRQDGSLWMYVEQAYDYMLDRPYRSAVLHIFRQGDRLEIANHRLREPEAFWGASRDRDRLAQLQPDGIERLCGCNMHVERTPNHSFVGTVEPGKQCFVFRNGKQTYLHSEFEVRQDLFISLDRGYDVDTDERVWGSLAGPFYFVKKTCFAEEVPA